VHEELRSDMPIIMKQLKEAVESAKHRPPIAVDKIQGN
jgi:hypothetical protein